MKRRAFLGSLGGLTVLLAGGGVWRASRQGVFAAGQGPAFEPWYDWRSNAVEGPLALVAAAILAANPHNTQPWLFEVDNERIDLYADTGRNLGAFDPYLREMHIGLGCALENIAIAGAAQGYRSRITLAEGELGPIAAAPERVHVARIELADAAPAPSPLFDAIGHRHTNRGPYDLARELPLNDQHTMTQLAEQEPDVRLFLFSTDPARRACADLIVAATESIIGDDEMIRDSDRWFRHSRADIQEHRDGPTLDAAGLPPLTTALAKMLPPPSAETNHLYWLDATREVHVATAPLLGLIGVRSLYDRPQNLRAGRAWQRMHLWGASRGLAMQPLNQPVEVVDRERELGKPPATAAALADLIGSTEWKPTFAFRVGTPLREAPPSPRRPLARVLV